MIPNVALTDRTVRMGAGLFLLASPLLELPTFPFNLLGVVLMATGLAGYCPLYSVALKLVPKRAARPAEARS